MSTTLENDAKAWIDSLITIERSINQYNEYPSFYYLKSIYFASNLNSGDINSAIQQLQTLATNVDKPQLAEKLNIFTSICSKYYSNYYNFLTFKDALNKQGFSLNASDNITNQKAVIEKESEFPIVENRPQGEVVQKLPPPIPSNNIQDTPPPIPGSIPPPLPKEFTQTLPPQEVKEARDITKSTPTPPNNTNISTPQTNDRKIALEQKNNQQTTPPTQAKPTPPKPKKDSSSKAGYIIVIILGVLLIGVFVAMFIFGTNGEETTDKEQETVKNEIKTEDTNTIKIADVTDFDRNTDESIVVREYNDGTYKGEINDMGERHGQGSFEWKNGNKYIGEWIANKRDGKGTFEWKSGDKYVGDFKEDSIHGQGIMSYADGTTKDGEWKDNLFADPNITKEDKKEEDESTPELIVNKPTEDLKSSTKEQISTTKAKEQPSIKKPDTKPTKVTQAQPQQEQYTPPVPKSKASARAYLKNRDGEYVGSTNFNGERHGKGTFQWYSGNKYEGEWRNNQITGTGTYYSYEGWRYEGQFVRGKFHGYGQYYNEKGKMIRKGYWSNGDMIDKKQ